MSSEAPDPRRWIALVLLCATQFMLIIDVSIVNVALPTIKTDLDFTDSSLQWVASAYALTFGGFLLLGGRCADLLGRRRLFIAGLALFTVASLACGFANTNNLLIAARAVQGLGGAMIAPAALSILSTTFAEGTERNKALAVWGAVSGAGGAVGVLLGGVLTEYVGWEWVFFVNIPIGVGAILLAPRLLRESRVEDAVRSFDVIGAILVTASLSLLVYTVVKTDEYHWFSGRTLGFFAVSVVLMVGFLLQRASARTQPAAAALDLPAADDRRRQRRRLHARRGDLRDVLPARALHAGAAGPRLLARSAAASATCSWPARSSSRRVPRRRSWDSSACATCCSTGMVLLTHRAALLLARLAARHATSAISRRASCSPASGSASRSSRSRSPLSWASATTRRASPPGLINTSQQIGGAVGVALLATVFTSRYADQLAAGVADDAAYTDGLSRAFLVGAADGRASAWSRRSC